MSKYAKELAIAEAASEGYRWLNGASPCDEWVAEQQPAIAVFVKALHPQRVIELLEAEMELMELKEKPCLEPIQLEDIHGRI